jgi:hypothetical protein
MAYQYTNAAREISCVKSNTARLLLMVLASAVENETGTGKWSAACLMHWTQLSKDAFFKAARYLEEKGILTRDRRRLRNRTNVWRLDIKTLESMRVSWDSIRPKDAVPEDQEEPIRPPKKDGESASAGNAFENLLEEEPICVSCHQEPVADEGDRCEACIKASVKKTMAESARPTSKDVEEVQEMVLGHKWNADGHCDVCGWSRNICLKNLHSCEDRLEVVAQ